MKISCLLFILAATISSVFSSPLPCDQSARALGNQLLSKLPIAQKTIVAQVAHRKNFEPLFKELGYRDQKKAFDKGIVQFYWLVRRFGLRHREAMAFFTEYFENKSLNAYVTARTYDKWHRRLNRSVRRIIKGTTVGVTGLVGLATIAAATTEATYQLGQSSIRGWDILDYSVFPAADYSWEHYGEDAERELMSLFDQVPIPIWNFDD